MIYTPGKVEKKLGMYENEEKFNLYSCYSILRGGHLHKVEPAPVSMQAEEKKLATTVDLNPTLLYARSLPLFFSICSASSS